MVDGAGAAELTRPRSDDVLRELILLRQQYGITRERIRTTAEALQRLPAAIDQMERRQIEPHSAAYEVVRCAVNHAVERDDFRRVLSMTLNFAGERFKLTDRMQTARSELLVGAKELDLLMTEAYGELASVLASLDESPCREDAAPDRQHSLTTARELLIAALNILLRGQDSGPVRPGHRPGSGAAQPARSRSYDRRRAVHAPERRLGRARRGQPDRRRTLSSGSLV